MKCQWKYLQTNNPAQIQEKYEKRNKENKRKDKQNRIEA